MPQGIPIDRDWIHEQIWNARDRRGRVKIFQKRFAETLGISAPQMNRIIREFETEGRLKKVGARIRNVGIYVVRDPEEFDEVSRRGIAPADGVRPPSG